MRNVSLDNPLWLLIAVPLLLAVVLPYAWAIRKENRNKAIVTSLILHILIVAIIAFAVAGTVLTTYMTKTEVVFVADVSYSSNRNLDYIDEQIQRINAKLPKNTQSSLICFASDVEVLADFGEPLPSVTTYTVDDSSTDIASALEYANTLFSYDTIKHVVLLTDGKESSGSTTGMLQAVENLYSSNVYIDVVYVDNNLEPGTLEVQISDIEVSESTYLGHKAQASVLLQSNTEAFQAIITLYKDGELYAKHSEELKSGFNTVVFDLDTSRVGSFDYEVVVEAEGDTSSYNNNYGFTQSVTGELQVLLITNNVNDQAALSRLYGSNVTIDTYLNNPVVPCTVEALCLYDQIVISGVDVSKLENASFFIESLDKVVSLFGKTLINMGNGGIQDSDSDVVASYENLLPVKYGNNSEDPKLYVLVFDSSRSMFFMDKLTYAKSVATHLLSILNDDDMVLIVGFSGEPRLISGVASASNRGELIRLISQVGVTQGTVTGAAMREAYKLIKDMPYENKQVMLISDGLNYALEADDPLDMAQKMVNDGIHISTVNICTDTDDGISLLQNIATIGKGTYYYVNNEATAMDVVYKDIAPEWGATVIREETKVTTAFLNAPTMAGITGVPNVYGYVQSRAKSNASVVLTVPYQKGDGVVIDVPLYASWAYGNGTVACFTSDLLGEWTNNWENTDGEIFMKNIFSTTKPAERVGYPYTFNATYDGVSTFIEVVPATINAYATLDMTITKPDGSVETRTLYFDRTRYYYEFETPDIGKYQVVINYSYGTNDYESVMTFYIARSPEYDSFVVYSPATLSGVIRDRGVVYEDDSLIVENNMDEVSTYELDFTIGLLAMAVALYLIDIIIRKLTWADIRSLFKKSTYKGG